MTGNNKQIIISLIGAVVTIVTVVYTNRQQVDKIAEVHTLVNSANSRILSKVDSLETIINDLREEGVVIVPNHK